MVFSCNHNTVYGQQSFLGLHSDDQIGDVGSPVYGLQSDLAHELRRCRDLERFPLTPPYTNLSPHIYIAFPWCHGVCRCHAHPSGSRSWPCLHNSGRKFHDPSAFRSPAHSCAHANWRCRHISHLHRVFPGRHIVSHPFLLENIHPYHRRDKKHRDHGCSRDHLHNDVHRHHGDHTRRCSDLDNLDCGHSCDLHDRNDHHTHILKKGIHYVKNRSLWGKTLRPKTINYFSIFFLGDNLLWIYMFGLCCIKAGHG